MEGRHNHYLNVNLSNKSFDDYVIPEDITQKHLGGRGIAARIILEELNESTEPLNKNNLLIFSTGPLQGTNLGGAGRHCVTSKSPKTGSVSDSYVGGYFGHELALSGYNGLIIRGKSESPVYITLIDGVGNLKNAKHLWGQTTYATEEALKDEYNNSRVSSIGPAGENLVNHACIISDKGRAAGRAGFGAVMGSKNLKAIVVKKAEEKQYFDKEKFNEIRKDFTQKLIDSEGKSFGKYGTPSLVTNLNENGILPTANFRMGTFNKADQISGEKLYEEYLTDRGTCAGCPIKCKREVNTAFNDRVVKGAGPEYEAIAAFGSLCLNDDLSSIILANHNCNKYGLDAISTGVSIAYAMEAAEKGYIRSQLEPDIKLEWGNPKAVIALIDKIAYMEGLGELLSKGLQEVEADLDTNFAQTLKGQEIPMHDPRSKKGFGISYATSPRGGTHLEGMQDTMFKEDEVARELGLEGKLNPMKLEGKSKVVKVYEDLMSFTNSAIMCKFTTFNRVGERYNYPKVRNAIHAVTGQEINAKEMLEIGERNYLLLKVLAAQQGYTRKEDDLTDRLKSFLPKGGKPGENIPQEKLDKELDIYYKLRGYDKSGPTEAKLIELGLGKLT